MWFNQYSGLTLTRFIETIGDEHWFWAVKRLAGNDTGASGGNQSGVYVPHWFIEKLFPRIFKTTICNDQEPFHCYLVSHDIFSTKTHVIYYNSKYHPERNLKKEHDEFRLTCWEGKKHPFQHPDSTGAIIVLAGKQVEGRTELIAWQCSSEVDETLVEAWLGTEVMPTEILGLDKAEGREFSKSIQKQAQELILPEWHTEFPTGKHLFKRIVEVTPQSSWGKSIDELLIHRRDLELALFQHVEQAIILPQIQPGFNSVEKFLDLALKIANRRKSRSGQSLELNLAQIFYDCDLKFDAQKKTERNKRPDFIFPKIKYYKNSQFPDNKLHMLAAKTCCKERWQQVLNEADRIRPKHLFTLQEGVSENQLKEMEASKIRLVVPKRNITSFPKEHRTNLQTLETFVDFIRKNQSDLSAWEDKAQANLPI